MLDTGSAVIEANTFDSNEGTDHAGGIAMHDANDGSTWALSKRTIQAAVDAASEVGGDVWVKQGDYQNSSGQFLWLRPFATLYGGFYGNEVSRSQRNPATYVSAVKGNNNYASFLYSGSHLVIDGCALTQGTRGMVCSGAQPLIRGVVFTGNGPGPEGAGMFCGNRSAPVIEKCRFIGNVTTSHGGGVAFHDCNSKIVNCVFAGNTARNFDEPSAISGGGAIRTKGGTCSIINNTFVGNRSWWSAQGSPGLGGGAIFSTSTSTITNNIFYDNRAGSGWSVYTGTTLSYCDAYNPGQSNTQANHYYSPGSISGNMYYSDPSFVNAGYWNDNGTPSDWSDDTWVNGDYHLLSGSPCVDAGTNTNAPTEDIDGNPRPLNGTCDMGAYEQ